MSIARFYSFRITNLRYYIYKKFAFPFFIILTAALQHPHIYFIKWSNSITSTVRI